MENLEIIRLSQQLGNWKLMGEICEAYPQFSHSTLKTLMWKRDERPGLNRCARVIGKRLYINAPLFGMWISGSLPEQQGE